MLAEDGVLEIIVDQFLPLFVEYSIVTLLTDVLVQMMLCEVPTTQSSPPFGDVTVIVGVGAVSLIVNTLLL